MHLSRILSIKLQKLSLFCEKQSKPVCLNVSGN